MVSTLFRKGRKSAAKFHLNKIFIAVSDSRHRYGETRSNKWCVYMDRVLLSIAQVPTSFITLHERKQPVDSPESVDLVQWDFLLFGGVNGKLMGHHAETKFEFLVSHWPRHVARLCMRFVARRRQDADIAVMRPASRNLLFTCWERVPS
jgi:hypothetical protein